MGGPTLPNFETYYLISIPGFVVGVMTGRFLSSHYWQKIKPRLGSPGRFVSGLFFLGYFVSIPLILGIMLIYVMHLPESRSTNLWVTVLVALWVLANFILEIATMIRHRPLRRSLGMSGR